MIWCNTVLRQWFKKWQVLWRARNCVIIVLMLHPFGSMAHRQNYCLKVIFRSTILRTVNPLIYCYSSLTQGLGVDRKIWRPRFRLRSRQLHLTDFDPFADPTFCTRAVKRVYVVPYNQAWKNPGCFSKTAILRLFLCLMVTNCSGER